MKLYYIIGAIVFLAVALIIATTIFIRKRKIIKLGIQGEKKVAKVLSAASRFKDFKVLNDVYLPLYDKTTQVDHILIGGFGMVVIETKNHRGEIYGDPSKKDWTHIMGNKKHTLYNPLMQNQAHIDCIRHILSTSNVYKVNIESLVVFSGKKVGLFVPKGLPIMTVKQLKKYLKKPKFEKDNNVDVDLVYNTLINNQVTDKKLISKHNKNVKAMSK